MLRSPENNIQINAWNYIVHLLCKSVNKPYAKDMCSQSKFLIVALHFQSNL